MEIGTILAFPMTQVEALEVNPPVSTTTLAVHSEWNMPPNEGVAVARHYAAYPPSELRHVDHWPPNPPSLAIRSATV